ncbi:MAG: hypothetical protein HQM07_06585 [Zetaproteobacteria bacterium]|nr:hypothetical protein [Zetaproteobacteria bacterium]
MLAWLQTAEGVSFAFDFIMFLCIFGGFFLWRRTSQQQRDIERKLQEATNQLHQASQLMAASMAHIQKMMQADEQKNGQSSAAHSTVPSPSKAAKIRPTASAAAYAKQSVGFVKGKSSEMPTVAMFESSMESEGAALNGSQQGQSVRSATHGGNGLAQVLHLHRRGFSSVDIASQLGLSLEEVDLMIKVHLAKG